MRINQVTARVTGPEPATAGLGRETEKEDEEDRTPQEQEEGEHGEYAETAAEVTGKRGRGARRAPGRLVRGPRGPQAATRPPVTGKDTCRRARLAGLRAGGGRLAGPPCWGAPQDLHPDPRPSDTARARSAASGGLSRAAKCRPCLGALGVRGLRAGPGVGQVLCAACEGRQGGACQAEEARSPGGRCQE